MTQLPIKEAKEKAARYCAYQERTRREVFTKLAGYGLSPTDIEAILDELEAEGFYDEERYAQAFCRGKFNNNKWGKFKIVQALRQKEVPEQHIQTGLAEIEDAAYRDILSGLIKKKLKSIRDNAPFTRKHKAARYAIGKGFEPDLVWEILDITI